VYPLTPVVVVVGLGLYKAVELIDHLSIAYHDNSDRADTRRLLIGRLKVDSDEVPKHLFNFLSAAKVIDFFLFHVSLPQHYNTLREYT
jgi:hypothetical protein